jgi:hypothetical protein
MTQAVCFSCGEMKYGAFSRCESCGVEPTSDRELMLSLTLTDHYFDAPALQQLGREIKGGKTPQLSAEDERSLAAALEQIKPMMGRRGEKPATRRAPWLLAGVASLIVIWTLLASYLGSRDASVVFGIIFGSGVVLFVPREMISVTGVLAENHRRDMSKSCGSLKGPYL